MKSINDLIWDPNQDPNQDSNQEISGNSDSPIVVTPNYIAAMCNGGGGSCLPSFMIGCMVN